ncbi:hypothetical protein FM104_15720 [Microbacterium esteraromaticum]|uniref:Uncharacterized protein n=1 Tax=Microbacterium esteraromaticum TaxID=57043 RepID=A0A1R4KRZ2_9MICO|nr:hypothetical protein FM104_15720 [Microbacterium esteraromaticum]
MRAGGDLFGDVDRECAFEVGLHPPEPDRLRVMAPRRDPFSEVRLVHCHGERAVGCGRDLLLGVGDLHARRGLHPGQFRIVDGGGVVVLRFGRVLAGDGEGDRCGLRGSDVVLPGGDELGDDPVLAGGERIGPEFCFPVFHGGVPENRVALLVAELHGADDICGADLAGQQDRLAGVEFLRRAAQRDRGGLRVRIEIPDDEDVVVRRRLLTAIDLPGHREGQRVGAGLGEHPVHVGVLGNTEGPGRQLVLGAEHPGWPVLEHFDVAGSGDRVERHREACVGVDGGAQVGIFRAEAGPDDVVVLRLRRHPDGAPRCAEEFVSWCAREGLLRLVVDVEEQTPGLEAAAEIDLRISVDVHVRLGLQHEGAVVDICGDRVGVDGADDGLLLARRGGLVGLAVGLGDVLRVICGTGVSRRGGVLLPRAVGVGGDLGLGSGFWIGIRLRFRLGGRCWRGWERVGDSEQHRGRRALAHDRPLGIDQRCRGRQRVVARCREIPRCRSGGARIEWRVLRRVRRRAQQPRAAVLRGDHGLRRRRARVVGGYSAREDDLAPPELHGARGGIHGGGVQVGGEPCRAVDGDHRV